MRKPGKLAETFSIQKRTTDYNTFFTILQTSTPALWHSHMRATTFSYSSKAHVVPVPSSSRELTHGAFFSCPPPPTRAGPQPAETAAPPLRDP